MGAGVGAGIGMAWPICAWSICASAGVAAASVKAAVPHSRIFNGCTPGQKCRDSIQAAMATMMRFSLSETKPSGTRLDPPTQAHLSSRF